MARCSADSGLGTAAEAEIPTPEGLAAHQISSLARWTGLRYLSGLTIARIRKYLVPLSCQRAEEALRPARRRSPAGRANRPRESGDGPRQTDRTRVPRPSRTPPDQA